MTPTELLAALEAATGPSGELDRLIADVLGWHFVSPASPHVVDYWLLPNGDEASSLPEWTASLDAALTLVPEDMPCEVGRLPDQTGRAWVYNPKTGLRPDGYAPAPALAIVIAAIRARGEG